LLKPGKEQNWDAEIQDRVFDSFHMKEIEEKDLHFAESGEHQRVISLLPHQLITTERIVPYREHPGVAAGVDLEEDIVKLAVLERHHHTGHIGLGFLGGYGLKKGAVASSIAHDSHNLIIAGTNDRDMMLAGNCVRKNKGGLAMVMDGTVLGELPLPIAGLMTEASAEEVEEILSHMKAELRKRGIPDTVDPFMTLAFVSLPVIPKLRLNTYGLVDVDAGQVVKAIF
ncbi:MAG: adenine deaminase C-terminal domain-containing protein, partial [Hungatella sp.]